MSSPDPAATQHGPAAQPASHQALYLYQDAPSAPPPRPLDAHSQAASLTVPLAGWQAPAPTHRHCAMRALGTHFFAVLLVNVLVWMLYFWLCGIDTYPWPMWVSFGTLLSVAAHGVNVLPWTSPSNDRCPRWIQTVFGNIVLANFSVWAVYAFTSCGPFYCGYAWPIWVSLPSCIAVVVICVGVCCCKK
ncbi:unnamed protein product [Effrenium voratum]|nr:unnamed protein product [Effrenium voratum]CAJ1434536.1 unnamed protein product [Effrenium voratum]|mmetsp:Transcript_77154/g.184762  ORF Transcript_77154/g.184762 Transcript_77154/m.184762 type:complete len:189 (-) Transcript_77154:137-703(-)